MVEKKDVATLFKIERISDDLEQLIPIDVIEGTYDKHNCTFTALNGIVYLHIEETEMPNYGYANRRTVTFGAASSDDIQDSVESKRKDILKEEKETKYVRFVQERSRIYKKSPHDPISTTMEDTDSKKYKEIMRQLRKRNDFVGIEMTPKEIVEKVKQTIKGQDDAIVTIATCLWATLNDRNLTKKQMLLIGPTGVGKTAIFKKLQKILDIPVVIFSVPGLSQAGYVGRSTDEILKQIYFDCNEDIDRAEKAIVILDEIDKIAFNKDITSADISTVGVQNELLKMVEGYSRVVEIDNGTDSFTIDTSNIIFIGTGAFQELYEKKQGTMGFAGESKQSSKEKVEITTEDLVKYGLKRELIGRFPIQVELNALTKEIFREIILYSDESELLAHVAFLESLDVEVNNLDEIIDIIIDNAMSKGIGARGLVPTISKLFLKIIYEVANNPNKYTEVIIGSNIVNDSYDFELVETRTRKRVRIKKENKGSDL